MLGVKMATSRRRPAVPGTSNTGVERQTRQDIENFLRALDSYPDRFARNPLLSFEQHFFRVAAETSSLEERRRG